MQMFEAGQLYGQFALTSTGCLGICDLGPTVLIYPEGAMYSKVKPEEVAEIIEEHFYLFSLKALAFIRLRRGDREGCERLLAKLGELDHNDSVGASVIRAFAEGSAA